jgi:hypothetical protein
VVQDRPSCSENKNRSKKTDLQVVWSVQVSCNNNSLYSSAARPCWFAGGWALLLLRLFFAKIRYPSVFPCLKNFLPGATSCKVRLSLPPVLLWRCRSMHKVCRVRGYEVSKWSGPVSAFGLVDTTGKSWRLADPRGRALA